VSGGRRRPGAMAAWALAVAVVGALGARTMINRPPPPVTHAVTIDASSYRPARLTIAVGDTVVWVNEDLIPHTVTAADRRFDSQTIAAGASWRLTVTARGATGYACLFHPTMTGSLEAR
jgi:plastocyanin